MTDAHPGPRAGSEVPQCRFCGAKLERTFVDLGMSPLCESFRTRAQLNSMEPFYPLKAYVCESCLLVQLQQFVSPPEIFTEYAYFSSWSDSWLRHAEAYCESAVSRFGLSAASRVVEIASNDGYLLQYFVRRGIPSLGIEPAANVAEEARRKAVETRVEFFGEKCARQLVREGLSADLIAANNVLAQVPELNDFVRGLGVLLKPEGVLTLEFPHLQRLVERNEFDTIYHEHFSYFSLLTVRKILEAHGLRIFDVEELATHGGSLRVYACPRASVRAERPDNTGAVFRRELDAGVGTLDWYETFARKVISTKLDFLEFLISAKRRGKTVAGYGAPGKATTLLMYCGIGPDLIEYTVDRNPYKHGRFMPGSHIPIYPPGRLRETRPDYVVILPWNLKDEIVAQHGYVAEWGGAFAVPIPELTFYRPEPERPAVWRAAGAGIL
jgi:SAM-dependent methyltransferase